MTARLHDSSGCMTSGSAGLCPAAVGFGRTAVVCRFPWAGLAGAGVRGTLQVRPCKLSRRLHVCAVLRTRQDRGLAPAQPVGRMRPTHAAHAPIPPPPPTLRQRVGGHGTSTAVPIILMRYRPRMCSVQLFGNQPYRPAGGCAVAAPPRRDTPCVSASSIRTRPSVGGGRRVAPGGTLQNMGPAHAPDGLGRTPNPGLAVYAGLRTRASFGAAYKDVLAACPGAGLPDGRPQLVRTETPPFARLLSRAWPATPT
jgi:hypothetical protein